MKLEKGKEYKYKEICSIRNEKVKTGKSKQLQLEDWKRYFEWTNPTTQKFLIKDVYDIPKDKVYNNWGGSRENAGRKQKSEEFRYLFNCFLYDGLKKNKYYKRNPKWNEIYFNNDMIYKYFGCYKDLYESLNDTNVDVLVFDMITEKIIEKARSWIFDKIKKQENIELTYGIIAYKTKRSKGEYKDDYLKDWNKYQQEYLKESKMYFIANVIKRKHWTDMIEYISEKFDGYNIVKKYHKIIFDTEAIKPDVSEYKKYRKQFNDKFVKEIYEYFLKKEQEDFYKSKDVYETLEGKTLNFNEEERMKSYSYIIDNYIKLQG